MHMLPALIACKDESSFLSAHRLPAICSDVIMRASVYQLVNTQCGHTLNVQHFNCYFPCFLQLVFKHIASAHSDTVSCGAAGVQAQM